MHLKDYTEKKKFNKIMGNFSGKNAKSKYFLIVNRNIVNLIIVYQSANDIKEFSSVAILSRQFEF